MKALCLYVVAGKGHYVPAKAIHDSFIEMGIDSRLEEVFDYLGARWLGRFNNRFWRLMLRFPFIERHVVRFFDKDSGGIGLLARFSDASLKKNLRARLEEFKPDLILATHPYGSAIMCEMLSDLGLDIPVYYYATDVFMTPKSGVSNKLKALLIPTEEGAAVARSYGQSDDRLIVCPFPLQREISDVPMPGKKEARRALDLDEDLFTLQLNLGGEGLGSLALLEGLLKRDIPMQIVIIGGMKKKTERYISHVISMMRAKNTKVYIRGFISDVRSYLAASDIIAGRAGINTIVEAMYAHRPFLITELVYTVIPSADYVEKYKVGWNMTGKKDESVRLVLDYASHPEKLMEMDENFSHIPIEYSARHLASIVVEDANIKS